MSISATMLKLFNSQYCLILNIKLFNSQCSVGLNEGFCVLLCSIKKQQYKIAKPKKGPFFNLNNCQKISPLLAQSNSALKFRNTCNFADKHKKSIKFDRFESVLNLVF